MAYPQYPDARIWPYGPFIGFWTGEEGCGICSLQQRGHTPGFERTESHGPFDSEARETRDPARH